MKLRTLVLASSIALTPVVAACGKASDLPHLQEEANGIVANFKPRFDDLQRRGEALMQRGNALGATASDGNAARQTFGTAMTKLQNMRQRLQAAPAAINTAATKGRIDLQREMDGLRSELTSAFTEINADLGAVENWIQLAEAAKPTGGAAKTQPVVPPPPAGDAAPVPEGGAAPTGAGTGDATGTAPSK